MTGKMKERVRIIMFIILLLVILLSIPLARCKPKTPPIPSCKLQNVPHEVALDAKTGLPVRIDQWLALCGYKDNKDSTKLKHAHYLDLTSHDYETANKAALNFVNGVAQ